MYVHPAFKIDNAEALVILRDRAFGLFVVTTAQGPVVVHLPFLVDQQHDGSLQVALHVARANPLHGHIGHGTKALLVCTGPDAYISPDWYGVPNQVPTWTYTSVHLQGTARLMQENAMLAHVDRLWPFSRTGCCQRSRGRAPRWMRLAAPPCSGPSSASR